jgi:adenylate cyclase
VVYLAIIAGAEHVGSIVVPIESSRGLDTIGPILWTTFFAFAFSLAANFVVQVARLLGQGELGKFVVGRYHRPRQEERIFLFLDLVDSTGIAERIGGVRFLELLNAILGHIDGSIVALGGAIHKYSGDGVIITWPVPGGLRGARCVRCALAIESTLARLAPSFESSFSVAPRFRYAVHLGPVVSGELGSIKREIAYLGDTVNTTERMLDACRAHGVSIVASEALLERVALPSRVVANPMGPVALRGKEAPVVLFALSQSAWPYRSADGRSGRIALQIHRSARPSGVPAAARTPQ